MNTDEHNLLTDFLSRLGEARVAQRDDEADRLIRQAFVANPDAAYLAVQRLLLQQQALTNANGEIERLKQALETAQAKQASEKSSGGFLGNLFGGSHSSSQNPQAPGWYNEMSRPQNSAPPPYAGAPQYAAAPAQGGSFLGSVARTAAGVAAGAFLFEGIEHLMQPAYGSGFGGGGFGGQPIVENVTENVYENGPGRDNFGDQGRDVGYSNADYNNGGADNGDFDTGGFDSSGNDDFDSL